MSLFKEEVAGINEDLREIAKSRVRALFEKRELLKEDPRQQDEGEGVFDNESPAAQWLDDMCRNSEALLWVYIENLASHEWTYKQLTNGLPHALEDVEGQASMFNELKEWAEV